MKFRIGSIPVEVQLSFFAASAVLGYRNDGWAVAIWVLVCFVSVLVHELGRALRPVVSRTSIDGTRRSSPSDTPFASTPATT